MSGAMRACPGPSCQCPWHARGVCQTWDTSHTALPRRVIGSSTDGRGRKCRQRAPPFEPILLRACDLFVTNLRGNTASDRPLSAHDAADSFGTPCDGGRTFRKRPIVSSRIARECPTHRESNLARITVLTTCSNRENRDMETHRWAPVPRPYPEPNSG